MTRASCLLLLTLAWASDAAYFGTELGRLSELHHGVRGEVFAVDSRTLFIKDFHYDGEGPAAYFYVGTSAGVSVSAGAAWRVRDERGAETPLRRYRGENVALTLPDHKTLHDLKWFAIWCDDFSVNFGDVRIPAGLAVPRPVRVGALRGVHGVSSDPVLVVDAQTLLLPNFSYDGEAPDAKFWVGRGASPSPRGVRVPDEGGSDAPLRRYHKKTVVLTLPGELTVFDIGHFGVWCEEFSVDFGHVRLPPDALRSVPPSLRMLGVNPQSKLNCEVLSEELSLEVRWAVAGDSIVIQLVGKIEEGEYMSFGVSGSPVHSQMVGGDVAVTWLDANLTGHAEDYFLDAKSQCAGVRGVCPDRRLAPGTGSLRLLSAARADGYSVITYRRALSAADQLDKAVTPDREQPVLWAVGPLNAEKEASYHTHYNKEDKLIKFGRPPTWNCPLPQTDDSSLPAPVASTSTSTTVLPPVPRGPTPWEVPPVQCHEPADGVFYVQTGPTGGKHGYSAITGHVGWGLSWYINGLLAPELYLVRGRKYTFVVEGGDDPATPARYHPFYITDDPVGGYQHKTDEEKKSVRILAGVRWSRAGAVPTGVGRRCHWTPDPDAPPPEAHPSFGSYQRALTLQCDPGSAGVLTWTPDRDTPDTVYYQCFTHRHLGWKIHVVDSCDTSDTPDMSPASDPQPQESQQVEVTLSPPGPPPAAPHYSGLTGGVIPPPRTLQAAMTPHGRVPARPPPRFRPPHTKSPLHPHKHNYGVKKPQKMYPPRRPPMGPMMPPIGKHKLNYQGPPNYGPLRPPALGPPTNEHALNLGYSGPATKVQKRPMSSQTEEQTLNLGQMDVIGSRVVHSHITLPEGVVLGEHNAPRPGYLPPEQIILGRPVELPLPLDQQMSPSRPRPAHRPPETLHTKSDVFRLTPAVPSTAIGIQPEVPESYPSDAPAAVNTGFKPETIVVESGFKPIIREPLMDRTADRREDAPTPDDPDDPDYADEPQHINHAYPSDTITQSFEPMFVPSPLDRAPDNAPQTHKTEQVFPSNHAKEDRPHPVYVPRADALFSPHNLARDPPPLDLAGSSPPLYLPPAPHTFTTYDGKTVSADTLTETHPAAATSSGFSAPLLDTPQFGPFKGEVPANVADALPPAADLKVDNIPTTKLKPVKSFYETDQLIAEDSQVHEMKAEVEGVETDRPLDDDAAETLLDDEEIEDAEDTT